MILTVGTGVGAPTPELYMVYFSPRDIHGSKEVPVVPCFISFIGSNVITFSCLYEK